MTGKVLVVGISGPSSSGKTTLARLLRTIFMTPKGSSEEFKTLIVHEDDFYKPDNRIPITTTSSGELVQDWDTIEAIDVKLFDTYLSYIRQTGNLPPKLKSKEDLNDATDSGVDETTINAFRDEATRILNQSREQQYDNLTNSSRGSWEKTPRLTIVFVDGFLLYAPPNNSAHPLRTIHDHIDLPIFLPVTYELMKERREGRTGYVTIGPAPTPILRSGDETTEESQSEPEDDGMTKEDTPVNFWTDPPGYVDDIVWPRYISNCSWLLLPESAKEDVDSEELKRIVGNGGEIRKDLGVLVAPQEGKASMSDVLRWAMDLILIKIREGNQHQLQSDTTS